MNVSTKPTSSRLTANIGVEVRRRRPPKRRHLGCPRPVRAAVAEHHVIVFRDQFLSAEEHAVVARAFGPIQPSPVQLATGTTDASGRCPPSRTPRRAHRPASRGTATSAGCVNRPPSGSSRPCSIPIFRRRHHLDVEQRIFDALPPRIQELCERSTVLHTLDPSLLASVERHHGTTVADRLRREQPGAEHPLVRRHPRTGPGTCSCHRCTPPASLDPPAPTARCSPTCTPSRRPQRPTATDVARR